MVEILLAIIRRTQSRSARVALWTVFALLVFVEALHLVAFLIGLSDPNNRDRVMIAEWLSHWPWGLMLFLLAIVTLALCATQVLEALERFGIIRKSPPSLRVEIARFERLSNYTEYNERLTMLEIIKDGATFAAIIVIEASASRSDVAKNWSFLARTEGGDTTQARIVDYGLAPPPGWPSDLERFSAVDGIRIEKGAIRRVYVTLGIKPVGVDMGWLSASFEDESGKKRTVVFESSGH